MTGAELRHWCEGFLKDGRKRLAGDIGIVSRVQGDGYTIVAVQAKNNVFCAGDTFWLQETYCREVVRTGNSVALTEVGGEQGLQCHPLYMPMMLEAYLAAPIFFQGEVWGTVNYTWIRVRSESFSDEDIAFVEKQGRAISDALKGMHLS